MLKKIESFCFVWCEYSCGVWFQGFDVTVLEGGYELGPKAKSLSPDEAGIRGNLIMIPLF